MIYLACPYWHEDPAIREARVHALAAFHAHLIRKPPRSFFYNPLANSIGAAHEEIPEAYWRNHGLHMVELAQSIYVFCLPGWMESKGVKAEIDLAHKRAIPVHYFTPEGKSFSP